MRRQTTASPFKRALPSTINEYGIDRIAAVGSRNSLRTQNVSGTNFVIIIFISK